MSNYHIRNGFYARPLTAEENAAWDRGTRAIDARRAIGSGLTHDGHYTRHTRDDQFTGEYEDKGGGDSDVIEVHNHLGGYSDHPMAGEEPAAHSSYDEQDPEVGEGDIVASYPCAGYSVGVEDGHHVVRKGASSRDDSSMSAEEENLSTGDKASRSIARDQRPTPPRTLAEMNRFNRQHYSNPRGRR
jgi:hypothetical protein